MSSARLIVMRRLLAHGGRSLLLLLPSRRQCLPWRAADQPLDRIGADRLSYFTENDSSDYRGRMSEIDWLSRLLQLISVTGQVEVRCNYGAPWRVAWPPAAAREIPYHVVLRGRAIIEDPETRTARELASGDIVLMPHGSAHVLHDGSGQTPLPTHQSQRAAGWMLSQNEGGSEQLDLLCGRFFIAPPHDRLIHDYLPANLVVRAAERGGEEAMGPATDQ